MHYSIHELRQSSEFLNVIILEIKICTTKAPTQQTSFKEIMQSTILYLNQYIGVSYVMNGSLSCDNSMVYLHGVCTLYPEKSQKIFVRERMSLLALSSFQKQFRTTSIPFKELQQQKCALYPMLIVAINLLGGSL